MSLKINSLILFVATLILFICSIFNLSPTKVEANTPIKWQYRYEYKCDGSRSEEKITPLMNQSGQQNWEAFAVSRNERGSCLFVWFKRPF